MHEKSNISIRELKELTAEARDHPPAGRMHH
jgi:hypothetical protein